CLQSGTPSRHKGCTLHHWRPSTCSAKAPVLLRQPGGNHQYWQVQERIRLPSDETDLQASGTTALSLHSEPRPAPLQNYIPSQGIHTGYLFSVLSPQPAGFLHSVRAPPRPKIRPQEPLRRKQKILFPDGASSSAGNVSDVPVFMSSLLSNLECFLRCSLTV